MLCPKCYRLNPDDKVICPFCSEILNQEEYERLRANGEVDFLSKSSQESQLNSNGPKYFKMGWLVIGAFFACVIALIILIVNVSSPSKNAVEDYAQAFYSADFQSTVEESAVNLEKCYAVSSQSSLNNFFGLFNPYSSYEGMLSTYSSAFAQNRDKILSVYGPDFKVKVDIKNEVKLNDTVMYSFLTQYSKSYGDILRNGEISEMRYVYAEVSLKSSVLENSDIFQFVVLKIDSEWYVLTDNMLNAVSNN